ncbi:MAG: hypothetical protein OXI60_00745 [Acidiferrobacterales bacterium]|nr:hypothetical protein [Acidiferrobacterales bacterium]
MPLRLIQIEETLNELLGAVLSSRRTVTGPARKLAGLDREQQEFALHWASVISKSNSEMAYQFVDHVSDAFGMMDTDGVTNWIIEAMDVYDRQGLYPGSASLREVDAFADRLSQKKYAVSLEDVVGVLNKYVKGVCGRDLDIQSDAQAWTDTETLYLPDTFKRFDSEQLNFRLYKATGAFLLAQTRYGTFQVDPATGVPLICAAIAKFPDPARALRIFESVEHLRLLNCLRSELPGLVRQMSELSSSAQCNPELQERSDLLAAIGRPDSDVMDSIRVVSELYHRNIDLPATACYQGIVDLEKVRLTTRKRVDREKEKFRSDLAMLAESLARPDDGEPQRGQANVTLVTEKDDSGGVDMTLTLDGQPVIPPEAMAQTAKSIIQDFGEVPQEYLVPASDSRYRKDLQAEDELAEEIDNSTQDVIYYDEWDYRRRHYRKNWCGLRELEMHPASEKTVDDILAKHSHLVREIRKSFEALRGDNKMLRRQSNGDDLDIDAIVENYPDIHKGNELTDRLFVKSGRLERNLAVVFMVDLSGSTKGWINDAERESLVLLSEALQTLGDRYAIYGFSGMTRKRCELYRIKTFEDPYDSKVRARIAGIRPQDYTRMGVIIRHLTRKLIEVDARTRVLITISDGKPDDYDGYRGDYGIEDTRQALMEARHAGVHPFCITIDSQAHDYLGHMYGHVNYTVVSDVRGLPLKVSDIYRRLTT